jgi:hypothetical protein
MVRWSCCGDGFAVVDGSEAEKGVVFTGFGMVKQR